MTSFFVFTLLRVIQFYRDFFNCSIIRPRCSLYATKVLNPADAAAQSQRPWCLFLCDVFISITKATVICKMVRIFISRLCFRFFSPSLNSIYFSSFASRIVFLRNPLIIISSTTSVATIYIPKISRYSLILYADSMYSKCCPNFGSTNLS